MKKITKCTASALAVLMAAAALTAAPVSAASVVSPKMTVKNEAKGVKISWKKAKGAQKYVISRKEGKKAYKTLATVTSGKKLSYTDKKAKAGKKYTYSVKSVNGSAQASSQKGIVRLTAPTSVKVKTGGLNKITYKRSKGAKKYEIYRAKVNGSKTGKYKKIKTTSKLKYEDWDFNLGVFYKYKVRAVNGRSKSVFSKTTPKAMYLSTVFTSVSKNDNYDGVRIQWDPSEGAKGYRIYRAEGVDGKFSLLKDGTKFSKEKDKYLGTNVYFYNDKNVTAGTIYRYYVIAYNGSIESKYDDELVGAVLFNEYDMIMQTGKVDTSLSYFYSLYGSLIPGTKLSVKSDNENIVKVEESTDSSGKKVLGVRAVSAGDAFITISFTFMGQTQEGGRFKIRVTDEPVYAATVKVGEKIEAGNYDEIFSAILSMQGENYEISLTTDTPDIITVTKDKKGMYYITGNKAGVGNILFTMKVSGEVIVDETVQVLVEE